VVTWLGLSVGQPPLAVPTEDSRGRLSPKRKVAHVIFSRCLREGRRPEAAEGDDLSGGPRDGSLLGDKPCRVGKRVGHQQLRTVRLLQRVLVGLLLGGNINSFRTRIVPRRRSTTRRIMAGSATKSESGRTAWKSSPSASTLWRSHSPVAI